MDSEIIASIDPGTEQSAFCILDTRTLTLIDFGIEPNAVLKNDIATRWNPGWHFAYEMVQSFGMPVGREVFETCVWMGQFLGQTPKEVVWQPIFRSQVKQTLCHSSKANDSTVRQALIDMFGGPVSIGKKKTPGPLYGVHKDVWSALAVGVTGGLSIGSLTTFPEGLLRPCRSSRLSDRDT